MKTVYVETSIPSAFVSHRIDPGSVYRRQITRRWWARQRPRYELWTSAATIDELSAGAFPGQTEAISLVVGLPMLEIPDDVRALAELYVRHHLMPEPASGDALHVALAAWNEVDYLLTWNIRHLANPNKVEHMTVLNRRMGLLSPAIISPEALWQENVR